MTVEIPTLGPTPTYANPGDAGADLTSNHRARIPSRGAATIRTGVHVVIPEGYAGLVLSRSGHGFKHGIRLANSLGLIDSGYRGEIMVRLHNDSDTPFVVRKGDRLAQLLIIPFATAVFTPAVTLGDSVRGTGGFGSTGTAA